MRILLLIIGIIFLFNVRAQHLEYTVDSLRYAGDLKSAIKEYSKLYNEYPENRGILYHYSRALAIDNQTDKALFFLKKFVSSDTAGFLLNRITNPDFYFLIEHPKWTDIENLVIEKNELFYKTKYEDPDYSKELWKMQIKHFSFRYHIRLSKKLNGENSPIISAINDLKKRINHENIKCLDSLINVKGWPKKSVVKDVAANSAFSVVYDADHSFQKKYFPIIKEEVERGEAKMSNLAKLIDRIKLAEGKEQIYGTQFIQKEDGTWELKDLFDPEYVNQRQKEVGFSGIEEELFFHGIYWDFIQKEK